MKKILIDGLNIGLIGAVALLIYNYFSLQALFVMLFCIIWLFYDTFLDIKYAVMNNNKKYNKFPNYVSPENSNIIYHINEFNINEFGEKIAIYLYYDENKDNNIFIKAKYVDNILIGMYVDKKCLPFELKTLNKI